MNRSRLSIAAATVIALVVAWGGGVARQATAEPVAITGATFEWSVNEESNTGAFDGSCNWMSAGQSSGHADTFAATDGNATVLKLTPTGDYAPISDHAARCLDKDGQRVTAGGTRRLGQKVLYSGGTGTADPVTGEVEIQWTGTFSNNFYDDLSPFWFSDPKLTVGADGNGTVTVTVGGYRSSMENPEERELMPPMPGIVIARLTGVGSANPDGFVATPVFEGVQVSGFEIPQSRFYAGWGSWPVEFVTAMSQLGTAAYWYSSGGAADLRKPPAPIVVGFGEGTAPTTTTTQPRPTLPPTTTTTTQPPAPTTTTPPMQQEVAGAGTGVPTLGETRNGSSSSPSRSSANRSGSSSSSRSSASPSSSSTLTTTTVQGSSTTPASNRFGWTIDAGRNSVTLGPVDGDASRYGGELGELTVVDTRDGAPAWSISGQVADASGDGRGEHLGWTPRITTPGGGARPGGSVAAGSGRGLSTPSLLAAAPKGHPSGPATVGAAFDLRLPAGSTTTPWSATLTITALG